MTDACIVLFNFISPQFLTPTFGLILFQLTRFYNALVHCFKIKCPWAFPDKLRHLCLIAKTKAPGFTSKNFQDIPFFKIPFSSHIPQENFITSPHLQLKKILHLCKNYTTDPKKLGRINWLLLSSPSNYFTFANK